MYACGAIDGHTLIFTVSQMRLLLLVDGVKLLRFDFCGRGSVWDSCIQDGHKQFLNIHMLCQSILQVPLTRLRKMQQFKMEKSSFWDAYSN